MHEPFLEALLRRARHYSIAFLLVTQTCFDVPASMLTNINNKTVFRVEGPLSRRTLAATLGLNPEQTVEIGGLPERSAVAKTVSFPRPYLIQIPDIEP